MMPYRHAMPLAAVQTLTGHAAPDPFALVAEELKSVSERLRRTILTDIPILSTAAEYFFKVPTAASIPSPSH